MSDLLLVLGLALITAAAFMLAIGAGLVVAGVSCLLLSAALADGKGVKWRS